MSFESESSCYLISEKEYLKQKTKLQVELLKLQNYIKEVEKSQHIIIFEGRDAAGKGGTIKRFMEHLNPRGARVVALDKPTDQEKREWYWQRYIRQFPQGGEITLWDRSWYNRAGVEQVMGFCTREETEQFYKECINLEQLWVEAKIKITKFWFSVSKEEQSRRFDAREKDPLKLGKLSPIDRASVSLWEEYTKAKEEMFPKTSTPDCPWIIVKADCKRSARIAAMKYILLKNDYPDKNKEAIGELDVSIISKFALGNDG